MTPSRNRRVLTVLAVAIVLAVVAVLVVGRHPGGRDAAEGPSVSAPGTTGSTAPASTPTTATPSTASTSVASTTGTTSTPSIDPAVVAAVQGGGLVPVLVRLDVVPTGTEEERAAQVGAAVDGLVSTMPPGSHREIGDGYTLATVPLAVDAAGLDAMARSGRITSVRAPRTYEPVEVDDAATVKALEPASTGATTTEGADIAWAAGKKGSGATIAVIDTGVQNDHPFLRETTKTVWEGCFASNLYTGFVSGCPGGVPMSPTDGPGPAGAAQPCPAATPKCTHGMHVAGIAVGGTGTRPVSGIAPAANLVAINVFAYKPNCYTPTGCIASSDTELIAAMQWLYTNRASFSGLAAVNMSIGGGDPFTSACDDEPLKYYVDQLAAVGIVTVVAAGNDGWTNAVSAPGCISTVVTVGAIDDVGGDRASFSNVGPQVAVMAPGVAICSSILAGAPDPTCPATFADGSMGYMWGTSMATPAVAGAIGLLKGAGIASSEWRSRLQAVPQGGGCLATAAYSIPRLRIDVGLGLTARLAAPCAPGTPVATLIDRTDASVSWTAPVARGTGTLQSSTVTASTGQTCTATAPATSCVVSGLPVPSTITFTVRTTSTTGTSAATAASNMVTTTAPPTTMFVPVVPARIADTRTAANGGDTIDGQYLARGPLPGGATWTIKATDRGGVPQFGVAAVALNVTVTQPTASGFLTVFPSGSARAITSNLNFVTGQTVPNMVVTGLGADGSFSVFNSAGSTAVVVDVVGWYPVDLGYHPLTPARLLDTRSGPAYPTVDGRFQGTGPIASRGTLALTVAGRGGVPVDAGSVVLNVTATNPSVPGYLTVHPTGTALPNASNVNFLTGETVPNAVVAQIGTAGAIDLYNFLGTTDVIVDVVGWMPAVGDFHAMNPARVVDTRPGTATADGQYAGIGALGWGATLVLPIAGRVGIPSTASAVVVNVTATDPSVGGYFTVYPSGAMRPLASNVNFVAGETASNLDIGGLGAGGALAIFNLSGSTDLVIDVAGWYE